MEATIFNIGVVLTPDGNLVLDYEYVPDTALEEILSEYNPDAEMIDSVTAVSRQSEAFRSYILERLGAILR